VASRDDKAKEAWGLCYSFFVRHRPTFVEIAASFGLNPGAMRALLDLDPDRPQPMGALAEEWRCDASNVTWIVDRLEEHGLAQRETLASDRRVRSIALTPLGIKTRREIEARMAEAPDEFRHLSSTDLDALTRILRKVVPE
jgi:DNA-binding MarR family transcriptional regulator